MACGWRMAAAGMLVRAATVMSLAPKTMRTIGAPPLACRREFRGLGASGMFFCSGGAPTGAGTAAGSRSSRQRAGDVEAAPEDISQLTPRLTRPSADYVRHAYSPRTGPVWSSVATFLGWEEERARALVAFGGVYYKPESAPATAKPKRELDPEREVKIGEYLRLYPEPRRYPAFEGVDWESKIVYESGGVMLVNKPAGVPSHATVDNFVENMLHGIRGVRPALELFLPHRLDIDTSGLVLVAKDLQTLLCINQIIKTGTARQAGHESPRARRARKKALRRGLAAAAAAPRLDNDAGAKGAGASSSPAETAGTAAVAVAATTTTTTRTITAAEGADPGDAPIGTIHKHYRALVEVLPGKSPLQASPVPLTHFQRVSRRAPKEFVRRHPQRPDDAAGESSGVPGSGRVAEGEGSWVECRLVILSATEAFSSVRGDKFTDERCDSGSGVVSEGRPKLLQEVEVELLTGRTHQIRGQLAAEGCPIYGDLLYGPPSESADKAFQTTSASTATVQAPAPATESTPERARSNASGFVLRRVSTPPVSLLEPRDGSNRTTSATSPLDSTKSAVNDSDINRKKHDSRSGSGSSSSRSARSTSGSTAVTDDDGVIDEGSDAVDHSGLGWGLGGQQLQAQKRTFVESPKMALQACHMSLELVGVGERTERHSYTLGKDTCWWAVQE